MALNISLEDVENLVTVRHARIVQSKLERVRCCGATCFEHLDTEKVRLQLKDFYQLRAMSTPGCNAFKVHVCTLILSARRGKRRSPTTFLPVLGMGVCRMVLCELLNVHSETLTNWCPGNQKTVYCGPHGLTGRCGVLANCMTPNMVAARDRAIEFILNLAEEVGEPTPFVHRREVGTRRGQANAVPLEGRHMLLPAYCNRLALFRRYVMEQPPENRVARDTFYSLFKEPELLHVHFAKREKGLCDYCSIVRDQIRGLRDQEANNVMETWVQHVEFAVMARQRFRDEQMAGREYSAHIGDAVGRKNHATISFDFAKMLKVPTLAEATMGQHFAQQFGLDVHMFGVVDENTGKQLNFLYREGRKHDSNTVISLLHNYLTVQNPAAGRAKELRFWADSCSGQNRNQFVMDYLYLRVVHRLNERIYINFMVPGHTHFSPDAGFGLVRRSIRQEMIYNIPELVCAIERSTPDSHRNMAVEIKPEDGVFYDFKSHYNPHFKPLKGIKSLPITKIAFEQDVATANNESHDAKVTYTLHDGSSGSFHKDIGLYYRPPANNRAHVSLVPPEPVPFHPLTNKRLEHLRTQVVMRLPNAHRDWWQSLLATNAAENLAVAVGGDNEGDAAAVGSEDEGESQEGFRNALLLIEEDLEMESRETYRLQLYEMPVDH